jgi:hypothetical protein
MKDAELAPAKDRTTAGRFSAICFVQVCVGAIHFVKRDEVKSANTFGQALELFASSPQPSSFGDEKSHCPNEAGAPLSVHASDGFELSREHRTNAQESQTNQQSQTSTKQRCRIA